MTQNVQNLKSRDIIKNLVILIHVFKVLHDAKKPMFLSRLSKNCHSRYDTICKIIASHPKIFKLTEISPNRKLVNLERDPIILEKISDIINNLRYLEHLQFFAET